MEISALAEWFLSECHKIIKIDLVELKCILNFPIFRQVFPIIKKKSKENIKNDFSNGPTVSNFLPETTIDVNDLNYLRKSSTQSSVHNTQALKKLNKNYYCTRAMKQI